ncbi:MAG: guanylate kinase [Candidatus Puniceispirillum sp.]|nr:guanylate kinase [Candidatus Pelagibacter sp.]MBA4283703.1 guanylate kinase [Candidatus Puniceispirillum sp.]
MNNDSTLVSSERRGLMLVLSSPSGAGKTTIVKELIRRDPDLITSTSFTTRPQRPTEVDGEDYFFIKEQEFLRHVENHEFLEHAKVFGNYYGTPKETVFQHLKQGKDVVFDIDWQGTQQISSQARDDLVTIFILPPSIDILEARLRGRNQDSAEIVKLRMDSALSEMSHWPEYNYVVVNRSLDESVETVHSILIAERHRRKRQTQLADFVNNMRLNNHS